MFSPNYIGTQLRENDKSQIGNHISCVNRGLLKEFDGEKFTEYLIKVDRNSYITNEDESLFSFGKIMEPIKKELVYVQL